MSKDHSHAIPVNSNSRSLWIALGLTSTFLIAEVIAGLVFNSLALLADAAHMMTDVVALAIALVAIRVARRPTDSKRTYGYHRFEILAAAFNALLLFGVAFYILYEAIARLNAPAEVSSTGMLVVAALGLVINLISMKLLQAGKDESLNVKGAYLEVWSDMLGSLGVLIAALVIKLSGWQWVDTVVAVLISFWVFPRTWILLKETMNILLEGVPDGIELDKVEKELLGTPGIASVHDLHVWALTSGKSAMTAHLVHTLPPAEATLLIEPIKRQMAQEFKIFHTTFQMETVACEHSADGCNFIAD